MNLNAAETIRITGTVQGVGFRPWVWRLAQECSLTGEVWNDAEGVMIRVWGRGLDRDRLVERLMAEPPPLARIESLVRSELDAGSMPQGFCILPSQSGEVRTGVTADAATCSDCLAEVMDPANRRYRYPFTNCTHCGPRLSIIRGIPYDRCNTSMAAFDLCERCRSEYEDPADRRFHAQPNACPECGPQVWLEDNQGQRLSADADVDVIETAARRIRAGAIVVIKGIGGFHLACDAGNAAAVERLRQRKQRDHKALALMARDVEMVRAYAQVDDRAAGLLQDQAAPILVLVAEGAPLAPDIAPGQNSLGFMLPYTPLHHLLMQGMARPLVFTSGNRSDEPQAIDNAEAHGRLDGIADLFLLHDRDILNRIDDSVIRIMDDQPRFLRRARGYAPQPILLPEGFPRDRRILALGGELKNSFCLIQQGRAILSQHMGDLEDVATYGDYRHHLALYQQLYDFSPDLIVVDRHPDYLSSQLGQILADETGIPLLAVQHHHAHIAACMVEHGLGPADGKVLGVALDGLGFGEDGTFWGGEFLAVGYAGFQRLAWFQPLPMLGGAKAIMEPWRNTLVHLRAALGWDRLEAEFSQLDIVRYLNTKPLGILQAMAEQGLNSPKASSAGRLFDAVAAALGLCRDRAGYEGQAAIELEALAAAHFDHEAAAAYGFEERSGCLCWQPFWSALMQDLKEGVAPGIIAARFHQGLAQAVVETAVRLCQQEGLTRVALSGGVFQNRLLLERTANLLRARSLTVLIPQQVPMNDGGLSLGQAAVALASASGRSAPRARNNRSDTHENKPRCIS